MDWDPIRLRKVLQEVIEERERQFSLYGSNPFNERVDKMLFILGEEVGEVNAAMVTYLQNEIKADSIRSDKEKEKMAEDICRENMAHVRKELVQVAAVAAAIVELIDYWEKYGD